MMTGQTLAEKVTAFKDLGNELPEVDLDIRSNLNRTFVLRPYQEEAFSRFIYYFNNAQVRQKPMQLLFHMATGSGKTLIMAGLILYLYKQGYRNFLFFVNSTNIINKTRDNFLNSQSMKYLFSEEVFFRDRKVEVKEVINFQNTENDNINIVFSTIQALHVRLIEPKENAVTFEDFQDRKIVLISDEAHHINVETKRGKLTVEEREEMQNWESTVDRIYRSNPDNILLEFTATADFSNEDIAAKYFDKIIFDYPLRQFRIDGYSKEVKVLQTDVNEVERALQAIILSQYRRKLFEKYRLRIKPVLLFKSKTIKESKEYYEQIKRTIKTMDVSDLERIKDRSTSYPLSAAFDYFASNSITADNLISELKEDFSEEKCIEVNSKEESVDKQIAVNTLENDDNEYRAVFAVDKLNEGWDVLNLFDIVRLYNTRDAKAGKPGNTTISEAQLIGRGARYCPFQIDTKQSKYQRKYDNDVSADLRICEELYYHSAYNPKYIQELNIALQEVGIKARETREIPLTLKIDFKESDLYKSGILLLNEQIKNDRTNVFSLPSSITDSEFHVSLETGAMKLVTAFDEIEIGAVNKVRRDFMLSDFGPTILRKAVNKLDFYRFDNLKALLPNLTSISEFVNSNNYLGKIRVEIEGNANQIANISSNEKLDVAVHVLSKIAESIASGAIEYKGTDEFKPKSINKILKDKVLNIYVREGGDQEYGVAQSQTTNTDLLLDLSKREWYVFNDNYGTSEEKFLTRFIDKTYDKLGKKYDQIYLVRNEKYFQIYNFSDGAPIEPDFVLFLRKKDGGVELHYQIFIEPKGEHLLKTDEWKENFLKAIKSRAKPKVLWKTKKYVIWGLPFYNEKIRKSEFEKEFDRSIG